MLHHARVDLGHVVLVHHVRVHTLVHWWHVGIVHWGLVRLVLAHDELLRLLLLDNSRGRGGHHLLHDFLLMLLSPLVHSGLILFIAALFGKIADAARNNAAEDQNDHSSGSASTTSVIDVDIVFIVAILTVIEVVSVSIVVHPEIDVRVVADRVVIVGGQVVSVERLVSSAV